MTSLLIAATRHAMLIVKSLALMIISASLSSTQVSAPSIPPFSTLVQMPYAHTRAYIHLRHCIILHTLTCVTDASLCSAISVRDDCATKPQEG